MKALLVSACLACVSLGAAHTGEVKSPNGITVDVSANPKFPAELGPVTTEVERFKFEKLALRKFYQPLGFANTESKDTAYALRLVTWEVVKDTETKEAPSSPTDIVMLEVQTFPDCNEKGNLFGGASMLLLINGKKKLPEYVDKAVAPLTSSIYYQDEDLFCYGKDTKEDRWFSQEHVKSQNSNEQFKRVGFYISSLIPLICEKPSNKVEFQITEKRIRYEKRDKKGTEQIETNMVHTLQLTPKQILAIRKFSERVKTGK